HVVVYFNQDSMDDFPCNEMYFYRFDDTQLSELHKELLPGILKLSDWSSSYLKGNVTADKEHPILFTSIPWDEGWTAKVDGLFVSCEPVMDGAFLSIPLTPGTHEIELEYIAPGAKTGWYITIFGLLIYVFLLCHSFIISKK
ncbi:MAG: YfhO family protein, partial [Eubacteriaceae bacterium]|nr:YfhO family protein [Eubacteriaceae bacterium]